MISTTLIILLVLILVIWIVIEVKRMKHKVFAILLIALILFAYMGYAMISKNNDINLGTMDGLTKATKIYFSWINSAFLNMKSLTMNAIKMDWKGNQNNTETDEDS
jgi:glucan phosphoethanolaminetransferase (alkaline phosphatase superfamily)